MSEHTLTFSRPAARLASPAAMPRTVGSWQLVRPLGEGRMATVYQARPLGSAADAEAAYAVKMLAPLWAEHPDALDMLKREACAGTRISHPHLVPILAANLHEPPHYIVMPCLQGKTLAEWIQAGESFALPVVLWIARQVAEALEALLMARWMHADVKPSNIFVSPEGHATLIDLGFAHPLCDMRSLADRPVVGTLNYIAPEMLTSALAADIRSDIYSLGVTLFEMLTGRLPFASDHAADLATEHRQGIPTELRVLVPHLPTRAARLVRQMLAKEPLRRPQTPREVVNRLAALEIETFADRMPL